MDFKEIQELVKLINKSNLTEFKLKEGDFELSIRTKKWGKMRARDLQALQAQQQQILPIAAPTMAMPAAQPAPAAAPVAAVAPAVEESTSAANAETAEASKNTLIIKSPIVGTFYRASSPDKDAYVGIGSIVEKGTIVCVVEAMKLFNEIESEVSGKIVKILVENQTPVQYDQPLFEVEPI